MKISYPTYVTIINGMPEIKNELLPNYLPNSLADIYLNFSRDLSQLSLPDDGSVNLTPTYSGTAASD